MKHSQEGGESPLRALRQRLGDISQQELATRLHTSIGSIGRWERNERTMMLTLEQMLALVQQLKACGWDVELFLEESIKYQSSRAND